MSKPLLVLFAACVGLSLLSLHLVRQMRAGQATIAQLQAQVATLERQQQQHPPPSVQSFEPAPTIQPEQLAPPPAPPIKEVSKAVASRPPAPAEPLFAGNRSREERMRMMREARERQRQLMQDPEYREALRVQHRSNLSRQYPGLAEELGLSPEQTDQLFNLLADQQLRHNDQAEPMWDTEGLDPASIQQRREKMQQQWTEMQRKNDAELAAQLGSDKLQAWKEYQSTLGARHQTEQLRTSLASRGVPLSDDANRAVLKAFAEAQKVEMQEYANMARANAGSSSSGNVAMLSHIGPTPATFERQMDFAKKRNQRVLDALSPYLTYEQREAVQKEQEAELKMQEAQIRIMRAQSSVDGSNGTNDWVSNSVQAVIVPAQ